MGLRALGLLRPPTASKPLALASAQLPLPCRPGATPQHAPSQLLVHIPALPPLCCGQSMVVSLPLQDAATRYKVQMKLGCSLGLNDTVALEATAALGAAADGNVTVSDINWKQIPLPGAGQ